jgi:oligopeptidase B
VNRRELLLSAATFALTGEGALLRQPITRKRPLTIQQLGRTRVDDYAWLKPTNWKEVWRDPSLLAPDIHRHLEAENVYCGAVLAPAIPLERSLAADVHRLTPTIETPPRVIGTWTYTTRTRSGATHPSWFRAPVPGGSEILLLDGAARAAGKAYLRIINAGPSPDGRLFAWAEDDTGAEKYRIFIKAIDTGQIIEGPSDAYGDFAITPDGQWLFWTWRSPESRPAKVFRRPVTGGVDTRVYEEIDPGYLLGVSLSGSGRFVFLRSWNDVTGEVRLVDTHAPEAPARLVEPRRVGVMYTLEHWNDRFAVLTNADGAADFKLMLAPEATPDKAQWTEWAPEVPGRTIIAMKPFAHAFVRVDRIEGNSVLVPAVSDGIWREPARFSEAAYVIRLQPSDYQSDRLDFTYESPVTPPSWESLELREISQTRHPGQGASAPQSRDKGAACAGAPPLSGSRISALRAPCGMTANVSNYLLERLHARAADGAEIPITVLRRASTPLNGSAPVMLTGYGAYGYSYETVYAAENLALVDRGWVWAVAHVRGGSEKGAAWFEAARRLKKKVSFTDFIACAEHLIARGLTRKGKIVAFGYSAGGLLVGAALNMRPDLFAGVIGRAPFVDMLNTMSDATHPLVPLTRPVWGDPLADSADYDNIASYSPYDNVAARPYPPVLATTAVADDRVGFWEPAKWIARLRATSTSGAPMLLHCEMSGGHGDGADEVQDLARMYAFAIWAGAHRPWPGRARV